MDINSFSLLDIKASTAPLARDYGFQHAPGRSEFSNTLQRVREDQSRSNAASQQSSRSPVQAQDDRPHTVKQAQQSEKDREEIKRAEDKAADDRNATRVSQANSVSARQENAENNATEKDEQIEAANSEESTEQSGQSLPPVISKSGNVLQFDEEAGKQIVLPVSIIVPFDLVEPVSNEVGFNAENSQIDAAANASAESGDETAMSLLDEQAALALDQNKQNLPVEPSAKAVEVLKENQSDPALNLSWLEENQSVSTLATGDQSEEYAGQNSRNDQIATQPIENTTLTTVEDETLANSSVPVMQTTNKNSDASDGSSIERAGVLSAALDLSSSTPDQETSDKNAEARKADVISDDLKNNAAAGILAPNKNQEKTIQMDEALVASSEKLEQVTGAKEQGSLDEPAALKVKNNVIKAASEFSRSLAAAKQPLRETIELPVAHKNWGEALAEKTLLLVSQKGSSARLNLVPHNLGPLEIKLQLQGDSSSIEFVAHHAHTKETIETAIPRLREMFESGGLSLGDVNVKDHSKHARGQEPNAFFTRKDNKEEPISAPAELPVEALKMGRVDYIV